MKLAVFDFDGTLYPKDTLPFLLTQWRKQKMSRGRFLRACLSVGGMYVRYKLGLYPPGSHEAVRRAALNRFTPIFHGMTAKASDAFFERSARLILPQLNAAVVDAMAQAKAQGFHTVLLSGGYQRLMDFVGAALGFDTVIATALHYTDGRVDASRALDIVCGDDKAVTLRSRFADRRVDWQASAAYADSLSDAALFELVGTPVAVNPEPELKELAARRGWRVLLC